MKVLLVNFIDVVFQTLCGVGNVGRLNKVIGKLRLYIGL